MEENNNTNKKSDNKKKITNIQFKEPKVNVLWIYFLLLGVIGFMYFSYEGGEPVKSTWMEVKGELIPQEM